MVGLRNGGGDILRNWLSFGKKKQKGVRNEWRALCILWLSTQSDKVMLHTCYCYPYFPFVALVLLL